MANKRKTSKESKDAAEKVRKVAKAAAGVKVKKKHKKVVLAVSLVLIVAIVVGCWFYDRSSLMFSDFFYDVFYELIHPTQPVDALDHEISPAPEEPGVANGEMLVHFVDVGQGDCIILQFPDGKNMVIDGGPRSAKNDVLAYIKAYNITEFEYLMLTHTDEDHCGSIDDIINSTDVKNLFVPGVTTSQITTTVYRQFIEAMENELKTVEGATSKISAAGMTFGSEEYGYQFEIVVPDEGYHESVKSSNAELINSVSPIMFLTFGDKKICFTGDSNEMNEPIFLEKIKTIDRNGDGTVDEEDYAWYDCDILKVAHHGSRTSSTQEFLDVVKPEIAVIQAGEGNKHGHPTPEALSRLENTVLTDGSKGAEIYCTIDYGSVVFRLTAEDDVTQISEPVTTKKPAKSGDSSRVVLSRVWCAESRRRTVFVQGEGLRAAA